MAEEIDFKNGRNSNFEGLVTSDIFSNLIVTITRKIDIS